VEISLTRIQELEECAVAHRQAVAGVGFDQVADLVAVERVGQQPRLLGGEDEAGEILAAQVLQERAEGGGGSGDAGGAAAPSLHQARHMVLDCGTGEGALEAAEVAAVGKDRVAAQAALDLQISQEFVDLVLHAPL
jgi:hypothetical protein